MDETLKELFEACRHGDLNRVKRLVTPENINAQDILGRRSTPLHFSSGQLLLCWGRIDHENLLILNRIRQTRCRRILVES